MGKGKVLIIGGGIVGLGAAWRLAQAGWQVTVLEQHFVGAGASGGAIGALVPYPPERHHQKMPMLQRQSIGDWPELAAELSFVTGQDAGWRPIERWQLFKTEEQFAQAQKNEQATEGVWKAFAQEAAHQKEPLIMFGQHGAALCYDTACVNVPVFLTTLKAAAEKAGAQIVEYCAVKGVEAQKGGIILETSKGLMQADKLLIAAGAWAAKFHSKLMEQSPTSPALGQALKLVLPRHGLTRMVRRGRIYLIPEDEKILVGSTLEPKRGYARLPTETALSMLLQQARQIMPKLQEAELVATWTGLRPKSETGEPAICWVTGLPNVAVAAGHYGIGYGLLPWTLKEISHLFAKTA